jgi:hypothetical protein
MPASPISWSMDVLLIIAYIGVVAYAVGTRGFELSATGLLLFAVAFRVLKLPASRLRLRSIFYLHMLALLHRCYKQLHKEALGYGGYCCCTVVGFSQNCSISWMWSVLWLGLILI